MTATAVRGPCPRPPCSFGTFKPRSPLAPSAAIESLGNAASRSVSAARGARSRSATPAAVSAIRCCSSFNRYISSPPSRRLDEFDVEIERLAQGGDQRKALDHLVEQHADGRVVHRRDEYPDGDPADPRPPLFADDLQVREAVLQLAGDQRL